MTQKEVLESVLAEIRHVKTHMPNGELKQMANDFQKMKEDVSDLKKTLLNPDNGVIVNTNKNTDFATDFNDLMLFEEVVKLPKPNNHEE